MPSCFACGKELVVVDRVGRSESCPHCGQDIHCCRNCHFYDQTAYNECREPVAERVVDKEQANFCDEFELAEQVFKKEDKSVAAKQKLEELFRKKS